MSVTEWLDAAKGGHAGVSQKERFARLSLHSDTFAAEVQFSLTHRVMV